MTDINKAVQTILGNTVIMYFRFQSYHWNVTGPLFGSLHDLFQKTYEEMIPSIDELAEFIRINGEPAPNGITQLISYATIRDDVYVPRSAEEMLNNLVVGLAELSTSIITGIDTAIKEEHKPIEDFLRDRLAITLKNIWKIKSHLG